MTAKHIIRILLVLLCVSSPVNAEIGALSFVELVRQSDIIVEGEVTAQNNQTTTEGGFKFFRMSQVTISKVYKGDVQEGQAIPIYNGSDFFYDVSVLDINKRYVLCLKRFQEGFIDTYYGRGQWVVDSTEGVTFVKDALNDEKRIYDEFLVKLQVAIQKAKEPEKKKMFGWF